ncbi:recombinase family protein [Mesorhizobium sp.]|uniref:recombinase family protein n=1 Tax=Mesorhizobium sp. TaxID=1871066 RepID=UPI000FE2FEFD|nr:recombinase family protein [Mesorhizobium sp.]RWK29821.1 MAG: recombinase family protein [Mesorhizobium sp.]RWK91059.1 MAG: recombinase family protein [Mesorhizobium sp.]TIP17920.1 MAG: recombinase family protein [Mesorhizobium sp.]TJV81320.1 MAG: recombinase family protein [Mesorhizobium sp.]TJW13453.1 MAG: recombinase family protein [Mesorhizobium sp.]
MVKTVAVYERTASKSSDSEAASNARWLENMAHSKGWKVKGTYIDAGVSGNSPPHERPGFSKLIDALLSHETIDYVLVRDLSRLGREIAIVQRTISRIHAAGVQIIYVRLNGELVIEAPFEADIFYNIAVLYRQYRKMYETTRRLGTKR